MFIYPYKNGSRSVKALKEGLDIKEVKLENSRFKGRENKILINWGSSSMSAEALKCKIVNHPDAVAVAANKRTFFEKVKDEVSIPEFSTNSATALSWLEAGDRVVVREKLSGHSGEGIVLITGQQEWEDYDHTRSKLYVRYIPKKDEYRVHVVGGEIIDVQRKAKSNDIHRDEVNWAIRNHQNGFVFIREGVELPEGVGDECVKAVKTIGLDFGAVDVVYNTYRKQGYVLEINTAPGLEGSSVQNYIEGLSKLFEEPASADPQLAREYAIEGRRVRAPDLPLAGTMRQMVQAFDIETGATAPADVRAVFLGGEEL